MKKILTIGIILAGLYACTGDFEEINTNPNTTLVGGIRAYAMFEPILYDGVKDWQYYTWFWNDELIQFTAFTGGTTREEHRYVISNGNWQTVWNMYARWANDAMHMYDLATEQNEPALQAIALTFKVLFLSNLTDMFGDIPYAEAFTARKPEGTKTPKFDSQKEVYTQMFADLEAANALYGATPAPVFVRPELDGMYHGNIEQWRKFNNSLYLRLLCRVSGRTEMNVGTKMTEILGNAGNYPVFASNDDNATVNFSGTDPYWNYFHATTNGDFTANGRKLTQQLIKMTVITDAVSGLQTYVDPRLPIIGVPSTSGVWKGTVAGCTREEANIYNSGTSMLNHPVFCRPAAPSFFMDYAEVQFILAEAALKGFIAGGEAKAKEYYTAAITASLQKWGGQGAFSAVPVVIADADIATFLDSDIASWDNAVVSKEELIANQKYLALFWTGMEAYHEYRRTGYPTLTIGAGTVANDFILPTRFGYPSVTMATNSANVQAAINRMGGNDMKTPVWWSKQAIQSGR
jgi:hypothetical protein